MTSLIRKSAPWLLVTCVVAGMLTPASAQPQGTGNQFSVSTPAEPNVAAPGSALSSKITVTNALNVPVTFDLGVISVRPRNNGQLEEVPGLDALGKSAVIEPTVTVPGQSQKEVTVSFTVPADYEPDIYFLGIGVQPRRDTAPAGINIRTRIRQFVLVEVPGVADRRLSIRKNKVPKIIIGNELKGSFQIVNTGKAGVQMRGQVFITSVLDGEKALGNVLATGKQLELLPKGLTKDVKYSYKVGGIFRVIRPKVEVSYQDGAKGLSATTIEGSKVIVLPVGTLVAFVVFVLLVIGLIARGIIRRRMARRPLRHTLAGAKNQSE